MPKKIHFESNETATIPQIYAHKIRMETTQDENENENENRISKRNDIKFILQATPIHVWSGAYECKFEYVILYIRL